MAVTDQQFLDHSNLNNAEFANRQVTLRGNGDPRTGAGVVGVMGWFYLDDNIDPPTRYEKVGPLDTDWELFTAEGSGSGSGSSTPITSLFLTNTIPNVSSGVRHILDMETPVTIPRYDTNGDWDFINNCMEAPANGLYTVTAHIEYEDTNSFFEKYIYLRSTGTYGHTVPGSSFASEGQNVLTVTAIFRLETGDRVYLETEHFAPVSVDILSTSIHCISNPPLPVHDHDDRYYTETEVDAIIAGAIGGERILGVNPIESSDGIRTTFTLPAGDEYLTNSLEIHVNGLYEGKPVEISSTQIEVNPPLEVGDVIRCSYIKIN